MSRKQSSVNIDSQLARLAVSKSKQKNLHRTLRGLIEFLLTQFNNGGIVIDFNPELFNWQSDKRTSIVYDSAVMDGVKAKIKAAGFASTNDFAVNLLLHNYLNSN